MKSAPKVPVRDIYRGCAARVEFAGPTPRLQHAGDQGMDEGCEGGGVRRRQVKRLGEMNGVGEARQQKDREMKKGSAAAKGGVQHEDFPGGHPS